MVNCIVIDDDQSIIDLFCDLLDMINVDILATGNNGKDAVELYEKHNPDIVFTDLTMPDYDGFYAVENIKDRNLNSKIIVVTGDSNAIDSYLFDSLNVLVINKPFDMHAIKQAITDIFLVRDDLPISFEIQYKFKEDVNFYSCSVNYEQYRNFKKLPIIQECEITNNDEKNIGKYKNEMQKALDLAVQNNTSHIRKLSEIITND